MDRRPPIVGGQRPRQLPVADPGRGPDTHVLSVGNEIEDSTPLCGLALVAQPSWGCDAGEDSEGSRRLKRAPSSQPASGGTVSTR